MKKVALCFIGFLCVAEAVVGMMSENDFIYCSPSPSCYLENLRLLHSLEDNYDASPDASAFDALGNSEMGSYKKTRYVLYPCYKSTVDNAPLLLPKGSITVAASNSQIVSKNTNNQSLVKKRECEPSRSSNSQIVSKNTNNQSLVKKQKYEQSRLRNDTTSQCGNLFMFVFNSQSAQSDSDKPLRRTGGLCGANYSLSIKNAPLPKEPIISMEGRRFRNGSNDNQSGADCQQINKCDKESCESAHDNNVPPCELEKDKNTETFQKYADDHTTYLNASPRTLHNYNNIKVHSNNISKQNYLSPTTPCSLQSWLLNEKIDWMHNSRVSSSYDDEDYPNLNSTSIQDLNSTPIQDAYLHEYLPSSPQLPIPSQQFNISQDNDKSLSHTNSLLFSRLPSPSPQSPLEMYIQIKSSKYDYSTYQKYIDMEQSPQLSPNSSNGEPAKANEDGSSTSSRPDSRFGGF
ncbi:MAG: hypothetical protein LBD81_03295 [Holosporaceae bacterium]|jgi:hypothetical protein|nr:hypothetical protein [Holosporaceae bacterium]